MGPAGDQSEHFPHQTGIHLGTSPHQTGKLGLGTSPTNWDQQGINLGTSPTKLGPETGMSRGSVWALPPPNWPAKNQAGHFRRQTGTGHFPHQLGPAGDQSGHFHQTGTRNWDEQGISLGTSPTKLEPAGDQPPPNWDQQGTSRGSIWALSPPNWNQQGIHLGTSSTKMGPAGDQFTKNEKGTFSLHGSKNKRIALDKSLSNGLRISLDLTRASKTAPGQLEDLYF